MADRLRRASAYLRVSTPNQARDDRTSLPAQREDAEAWAASHRLQIVAWYIDDETGTSMEREQFLPLMEAARRGEFEVVIVRDFSRFARNEWGAMARLGDLILSDIELHEYAEGNIIRQEDASAFILSSVKAFSAASQAKNIKRDTKRGQQFAIARGVPFGRAPYGYRREGAQFVVDPDEAEVVRRVFDWYTRRNLSDKSIARRLNADGVTSPSGGAWAINTVAATLQRPTYKGEHRWGEAFTPVEPIISEEVWELAQVQRRLKRNVSGRAQNAHYLLSGLLRCGHCQGAMAGRKRKVYVCSTHHNGGPCNHRRGHGRVGLEARVLDALADEAPRFLAMKHSAEEEVTALRRELASVREQREAVSARLQQAVRDYLRGKHDENVYDLTQRIAADEQAALEREEASLSERLADAEERARQAHAIPDMARSLKEALDEMGIVEAKAVLRLIVKRIVVWDDGRVPDLYL